MDFRLSAEQTALRDGLRELLARRFGRDALRDVVDRPRLDRALWRELGAAGLFALRLPESRGGTGLGLPEAVVLFEECGRSLLPGPLVATFLAAGEVAGAERGEVVVTEVSGGLVPWLEAADVVRGVPTGGASLNAVGSDGSVGDVGSAAEVGSVVDTGSVADVNLVADADSGAFAAVAVRSVDPLTPLHVVADRAGPVCAERRLLYAAEQLGSAGRTLDMAVQHARQRQQFGRAVGGFQAIKHLCADMLVRVEMARVAVYAAAVTGDPVEIAAAGLLADEAAVRGARDCLQVYGGMGFTWDADVHLHLKRAWVRAELAGGARAAEETLAAALGMP
ncbi:acyl-CoA dehydrogenase family protein [Streptomyces sp. NPDC046939]|uniref:acyl-CoA dehydrogenase family protein n=1 Tax=Streptomyces sp. NPDC046939 TaxID=3155376 RepID=UPI0033CE4A13